MRNTAAVVAFIFLSACGGNSEAPNDNHGFGWEFTARSTGGLHLRQAGAVKADADLLESIAEGVEACAGIDLPPPPFVIVVPAGSLGDRDGSYRRDPPLILVETMDIYAHEVLHYLLDLGTGNTDPSHQSPLWAKCFPDEIIPIGG